VVESQSDDQTHKQSNKAKPVIQRMMAAWGLTKQYEIAGKLNSHNKTAANWIQQGQVPISAIYKCHLATGRSMDWLLYGDSADKTVNKMTAEEIKCFLAPILQMTVDGKMITVNSADDINFLKNSIANGLVRRLGS
jgi:hypothetical protein